MGDFNSQHSLNEVVELDDDDDSAIGTLDGSDTQTLSSWITKYRVENGRTYHAYSPSKYWGPNDEQAQDHLDMVHHLFLMTFDGKLYLAPIPPTVLNVLDLGTGTGIWAIDFADEFPAANVIGTDLSPIQPRWIPPNCKFEIDDCEEDWTWPDNHFDYIHIRSLFGCVQDWPRLYRQAMRCLRPGGYLEQSESAPGVSSDDGSVNLNNAIGRWHIEAIEVAKITGRTFEVYKNIKDDMNKVGFQNLVEYKFKWPVGPWPKDKKLKQQGRMVRVHMDTGLENWCMALLTNVMGWTREQVEAHCAKMREDLYNRSIHGYVEKRVVYGQKPYS